MQLSYDFAKGSTAVLKTSVRDLIVAETVRTIGGAGTSAAAVPMETA